MRGAERDAAASAALIAERELTIEKLQAAAALEGRFGWVQPAGGAFLVSYGTYQVLVATLGAV